MVTRRGLSKTAVYRTQAAAGASVGGRRLMFELRGGQSSTGGTTGHVLPAVGHWLASPAAGNFITRIRKRVFQAYCKSLSRHYRWTNFKDRIRNPDPRSRSQRSAPPCFASAACLLARCFAALRAARSASRFAWRPRVCNSQAVHATWARRSPPARVTPTIRALYSVVPGMYAGLLHFLRRFSSLLASSWLCGDCPRTQPA